MKNHSQQQRYLPKQLAGSSTNGNEVVDSYKGGRGRGGSGRGRGYGRENGGYPNWGPRSERGRDNGNHGKYYQLLTQRLHNNIMEFYVLFLAHFVFLNYKMVGIQTRDEDVGEVETTTKMKMVGILTGDKEVSDSETNDNRGCEREKCFGIWHTQVFL